MQDFRAAQPANGFSGANVLFDSQVTLVMGLEEHLLTMFRGDDFEFHDGCRGQPSAHGTVTQPITARQNPVLRPPQTLAR
jgi:hypothetical protein